MKNYIFLFSLFISNLMFAQIPNSIKGRWTIKASVAMTHSGKYDFIPTDDVLITTLKSVKTPSYRLEACYGIANNMELGLYIGSHKHLGVLNNSKNKEFSKQIGFTYNYHLLPLIFKEKTLPIDIYATARFGGIFLLKQKSSKYYGFNAEYGIGIGINYFFIKNFGVYADYLIGDFNYRFSSTNNSFEEEMLRDIDKIRFGFVLKF